MPTSVGKQLSQLFTTSSAKVLTSVGRLMNIEPRCSSPVATLHKRAALEVLSVCSEARAYMYSSVIVVKTEVWCCA